jgi:hypothetical protein
MEHITSGTADIAVDKVTGNCRDMIDHAALCEKLTRLGKFADDIKERVESEKNRRNSHNSDR